MLKLARHRRETIARPFALCGSTQCSDKIDYCWLIPVERTLHSNRPRSSPLAGQWVHKLLFRAVAAKLPGRTLQVFHMDTGTSGQVEWPGEEHHAVPAQPYFLSRMNQPLPFHLPLAKDWHGSPRPVVITCSVALFAPAELANHVHQNCVRRAGLLMVYSLNCHICRRERAPQSANVKVRSAVANL